MIDPKDVICSWKDLTKTEQRIVLILMMTAASNLEVAEILGVSRHTIKRHLDNVREKTQLSNRSELIVWAYAVV